MRAGLVGVVSLALVTACVGGPQEAVCRPSLADASAEAARSDPDIAHVGERTALQAAQRALSRGQADASDWRGRLLEKQRGLAVMEFTDAAGVTRAHSFAVLLPNGTWLAQGLSTCVPWPA